MPDRPDLGDSHRLFTNRLVLIGIGVELALLAILTYVLFGGFMHPSRDLVIGLDSSTSACKAIVWDRRGRAIAQGRSYHPISLPRPAWHEQPADAWWQAACHALRQAASQVNTSRLAALCIAHQRETFVPVDEYGHPLRPGILWMDERARSYLAELERKLDPARFHQITGKPLSGNLVVGKLIWLKENEPEIFSRTALFLDVHAYLSNKLTGLYCSGWGSADPTGLFDMTRHSWSEEILSLLGVKPDQLPPTLPSGSLVGTVSAQAAQECGLPAGLPLVAGLGDGQSSGLGAKVASPGATYISLGTSVVAGTHSDRYLVDRAFRTMCSGIQDNYILETVLLGGAYTISWFLDKFGAGLLSGSGSNSSAQDFFDTAAKGLPPGSEGLMLVPYWNSAMNPYWDASASGIIAGWRGIHGPGHLYRAILEGIAFEERLHLEGMEAALDHPIERLVAVGGGSQSDLWCQIIADITGKMIFRSNTSEAAALGAGILAASSVGLYPDVRQAAEAMTGVSSGLFVPDERRRRVYDRLYQDVYLKLFPSLQSPLSLLAELVEEASRVGAEQP